MLMLDGEALDALPRALPAGTAWIDLLDATTDEIAWVEAQTGLHVPTQEELDEIESSSRLRTQGGALYVTSPVVYRAASGTPVATSLGFALDRHHLITIRHARLTAFTTFAAEWAARDAPHPGTSGAAFVGLIDALVDRMADVLENVGTELDAASQRVFRAGKSGPPAREDADPCAKPSAGSAAAATSPPRSATACSASAASCPTCRASAPPGCRSTSAPGSRSSAPTSPRSTTTTHLVNKVQLLLDATLGLINIEQSNIIKVLTIVSVVGVPPTLVASMLAA